MAKKTQETEEVFVESEGVSLYYRIGTLIRQKIINGEYQPGSTLPKSKDLEKEYGVSDITVRKALANLQSQGLIRRIRGKGTIVDKVWPKLQPMKLSGSITDVIKLGSTPVGMTRSTQILAPKDVLDKLGLKNKDKVFKIERVRIINDEPFSYLTSYVLSEVGEKIKPKSLTCRTLWEIFQQDLKLEIKKANQTIEAEIADVHLASLLKCRIGDPLLRVKRTVFDTDGRPIEYAIVYYRGDRFMMEANLARRRSHTASHEAQYEFHDESHGAFLLTSSI